MCLKLSEYKSRSNSTIMTRMYPWYINIMWLSVKINIIYCDNNCDVWDMSRVGHFFSPTNEFCLKHKSFVNYSYSIKSLNNDMDSAKIERNLCLLPCICFWSIDVVCRAQIKADPAEACPSVFRNHRVLDDVEPS